MPYHTDKSPVQFLTHHAARMQGFSEDMYDRWLGYEKVEDVFRRVSPEDLKPTEIAGRPGEDQFPLQLLVSPNVVREARDHFACPAMIGALLGALPGGTPDEFSHRHYTVSLHGFV